MISDNEINKIADGLSKFRRPNEAKLQGNGFTVKEAEIAREQVLKNSCASDVIIDIRLHEPVKVHMFYPCKYAECFLGWKDGEYYVDEDCIKSISLSSFCLTPEQWLFKLNIEELKDVNWGAK